MSEYLPLVDETGEAIGRAPRSDCHRDPRLIHPVVHLHLFDSQNRLLLQRRSPAKDLFPGFWDTAVGGHVAFGENISEALERETREELGIPAAAARLLYTYLWKGRSETEFVSTFRLDHDGPFAPNPEEVAEIKFLTKEEIEGRYGRGFFTPNFEDEYRRLGEHGEF